MRTKKKRFFTSNWSQAGLIAFRKFPQPGLFFFGARRLPRCRKSFCAPKKKKTVIFLWLDTVKCSEVRKWVKLITDIHPGCQWHWRHSKIPDFEKIFSGGFFRTESETLNRVFFFGEPSIGCVSRGRSNKMRPRFVYGGSFYLNLEQTNGTRAFSSFKGESKRVEKGAFRRNEKKKRRFQTDQKRRFQTNRKKHFRAATTPQKKKPLFFFFGLMQRNAAKSAKWVKLITNELPEWPWRHSKIPDFEKFSRVFFFRNESKSGFFSIYKYKVV